MNNVGGDDGDQERGSHHESDGSRQSPQQESGENVPFLLSQLPLESVSFEPISVVPPPAPEDKEEQDLALFSHLVKEIYSGRAEKVGGMGREITDEIFLAMVPEERRADYFGKADGYLAHAAETGLEEPYYALWAMVLKEEAEWVSSEKCSNSEWKSVQAIPWDAEDGNEEDKHKEGEFDRSAVIDKMCDRLENYIVTNMIQEGSGIEARTCLPEPEMAAEGDYQNKKKIFDMMVAGPGGTGKRSDSEYTRACISSVAGSRERRSEQGFVGGKRRIDN